ncbi:hypothetical protein EZS27_020268 [termite gut metagenome]|uniref:ISAzo13 family transposase n=1 Tax=termite gut metagenome TaxID=433724 RepID=A0A5J4RAX3_9ZZZZ
MDKLKEKLEQISSFLTEKQRRIVYATEANQIGRGGKSQICRFTNMSFSTLHQGMKDLPTGSVLSGSERIRKKGAGRKKQTDDQP